MKMLTQKKSDVPLEEALHIAEGGWYSRAALIAAGESNFAGFVCSQAMSIVVTAAGCDLNIDSYQKGLLSSMGYAGMIFSSHLAGAISDIIGRRKILIYGGIACGVSMILSSFAPNASTLMVATFVAGFLAGGIFTPGYVYASEFASTHSRSAALVIVASMGALSNIFLPGVAWLVLPIDLDIGDYHIQSWRIFLVLLSLPLFLCATAFYYLPDTPMFLLNEGKKDETMELLRNMYSVNKGKRKEDFPVMSICLDGMDEAAQVKRKKEGRSCMEYVRTILKQTGEIFKPTYLGYTLLSTVSIVILAGINNVFILWLPEMVRQLFTFSDGHAYYNFTLCDVMSNRVVESGENECALNYSAYIPGIIVGAIQFPCFYLVDAAIKLTGIRPTTVVISLLAAGASIILIFSKILYLTVASIGTVLVSVLVIFPPCLSIYVSYFPTSIRSNAASIIMLAARLGSVFGTQIIGALFQTYCEPSFGVISVLLSGHVFLCAFMPLKRAWERKPSSSSEES